jgi:hypothetical protein
MELLVPKKTAHPQEQAPNDDLLDHRRTQVATIEPKLRRRRRWLWLKGGRIGVESKFNRKVGDGRGKLTKEADGVGRKLTGSKEADGVVTFNFR